MNARVRSLTLVLGVLCATALAAAPARAGCTLNADGTAVKRSIGRQTRCNDRKLRKGPTATCDLTTPPGCAGTLVTDGVALAYGPNNPAGTAVDAHAVKAQLACQRRIGRGVSGYVGTKLRGLIRGKDPATLETKARRRFDQVPDRCLVNVAQDVGSGIVLPAVGPQCAAAVGDAGDPVQGTPLRDCLLTLQRVWVDRWGPNPQPLRPNIVFILTDDQRWDTTDGTHFPSGAFVMPRTRAELADKGVEFTQAFMTTPLCCPSYNRTILLFTSDSEVVRRIH